MKKIALIMDGWKRYFTYAWPAGILQRIHESGEDINLYIFNSSGDWSWDADFNIGEYNIYKLPDLNDFDGIVMDLNNIRYPEVANEIADIVRKTGKPAISISNKFSGFYYVGVDNRGSMTTMIEHLYTVHNCRRFWFMMGPQSNYENNIRTNALKEFMHSHHLAYSENDFYFESYEFSCGYRGFTYMASQLDKGGQLPDAVICASDNIAVGVLNAAEKMGYKVPDDFCVTGFDNFDKAAFYSPKITTIGYIREDIGYLCADLLIRIWDGQTVEKYNYADAKSVYWDSCGCKSDSIVDQEKRSKEQILYEIETIDFEEQVLGLEYAILNCKSIKEISACIPACIPALKCDAMYIVLDEHMNDFHQDLNFFNPSLIDDEKFHVHSYPEKMSVEFAYDMKKGTSSEKCTIDSLFPMFDYTEKGGMDFLFMPLHFRQHTIGYFVIRNAVYLMEKQYLFKVLNVLISAMRNLYEKEKLGYMNKMLADMNVKDAMTGLYNRLGFQKLVCSLFDEKKSKGENLLIMFVDMDRLKYINDNFGHDYGDNAINIIASTIMAHCGKCDIPVRNGGDEFIIVCENMNQEKYGNMISHMREEVTMKAKEQNLPFDLTFSVGAVYTDMATDKTLDDYIRIADETMYEEKTRKKANRI
ncbi:MAG: GGDEF domain-containing protein [Lachnospiraceae bacterium]|nr:GGDEF domain-containing protein [Lachnospiraceae bacterium]